MTWRLVIAVKIQERLRTLPPKTKQYVRQAFREITQDPKSGKFLKEELEGFHSYKTGRFRIVYKIRSEAHVIEVLGIGRRETIYAEVAELAYAHV